MYRLIIILLMACSMAASGCNNCEALEEKICEDLGAEDCKYWKKGNGPDALISGRRSAKGCFNARFNPGQYEPYLQGAKAMADAMKKAEEPTK